MKSKILKWFAIIGSLLLAIVYLGVGAVAVDGLTTPKRDFSTAFNLACQEMRVPARGDEVEIAGW